MSEKYKRPWLRKCPFCNSPADHWPKGGSYQNEVVSCSNHDGCGAKIGSRISWATPDVVKKWNTRPKTK